MRPESLPGKEKKMAPEETVPNPLAQGWWAGDTVPLSQPPGPPFLEQAVVSSVLRWPCVYNPPTRGCSPHTGSEGCQPHPDPERDSRDIPRSPGEGRGLTTHAG